MKFHVENEWEISCKCEIDITSDGLVARFTKTAVPEDGHRVTAETSSGINSILRGTVLCFLGGGGGGGGGSCTISWGRLGREVHRFRGGGGVVLYHGEGLGGKFIGLGGGGLSLPPHPPPHPHPGLIPGHQF